MANPEWGTKRVCLSCGARFYDLQKRPIVCPECEEAFAPEAFQKGRGRRTPAPVETVVAAKVVKAPKPAAVTDEEQSKDAAADEEIPDIDVDVEVDDDDEDEDSIIEDASELGEDDDDVAEVIDSVDDDKET